MTCVYMSKKSKLKSNRSNHCSYKNKFLLGYNMKVVIYLGKEGGSTFVGKVE